MKSSQSITIRSKSPFLYFLFTFVLDDRGWALSGLSPAVICVDDLRRADLCGGLLHGTDPWLQYLGLHLGWFTFRCVVDLRFQLINLIIQGLKSDRKFLWKIWTENKFIWLTALSLFMTIFAQIQRMHFTETRKFVKPLFVFWGLLLCFSGCLFFSSFFPFSVYLPGFSFSWAPQSRL